MGTTGINRYYGTPRNPIRGWRRIVPGGSSSGSAVSVAAGEADVAFGTDTAGSIHVPAACCGIYGLKTTFGLGSLNADVLTERQYRHLMAGASSDDVILRLDHIALRFGVKAASLAPRNSEAQISAAISQGKMLPLLSKGEQLRISLLIKAQAETAILLNPNHDPG